MLNKRLGQVAKYILPGSIVVDVGTDHAYLPIFLIKNNIASRIIGIELNAGPYKKALENIKINGVTERVQLINGNGLKPVLDYEVDVVVVAGMGGKTIVQILKEGFSMLRKVKRVILQPMNGTELVRNFLFNNKYLSIIDEDLILDGGRLYEIIVAGPGPKEEFDDILLEIGPILLKKKHPLLPLLLEEKIQRYRNIANSLDNSSSIYNREKIKYYDAKANCLEKVMVSCL
jgi:tRNA (adenine22-N1)-methyltransferase